MLTGLLFSLMTYALVAELGSSRQVINNRNARNFKTGCDSLAVKVTY